MSETRHCPFSRIATLNSVPWEAHCLDDQRAQYDRPDHTELGVLVEVGGESFGRAERVRLAVAEGACQRSALLVAGFVG